jgi:hypothetical protein
MNPKLLYSVFAIITTILDVSALSVVGDGDALLLLCCIFCNEHGSRLHLFFI